MSAVIDPGVGQLRRRRCVVLHADIADYSRLMADDEAATVATVQAYQRLVTAIVKDAGGELINFVGDSFLAIFDDAPTGMHAAVAICTAVAAHNRGLPRSRRAWFRSGLDAGEIVIADDQRYFGDPLNIAARIQALAEVGGINVTEAVYAALDEPALRLVGLGARRLKNIPEPVRVYRWTGTGEVAEDGRAAGRGTPIVAVLPTIRADHATDRAVAAAIRLDVVEALSKLPGLEVVDQQTVDADPAQDVALVAYVLNTGVVRSGTRVRAYASLEDLETVNRVWGGRWQGTIDDLFALQDTVTSAIVRAVEVELLIGQPAMIYRSELDGVARVNVYRGWYQLGKGTTDGWRQATALFSSLLELHPDSVTGHALTAFVLWWGGVEGLSDSPTTDLDLAAAHAVRGIELGDYTGLSQLVVAALRLHAGDDLDAALADAQASLSRRPTCDISYIVLGSVQRYLGRWEAAVDACRQAQQLSPLHMPWIATVQASAYYVGEQYDDAARLAEQAVERQPDNREALLVLAASQQAMGLPRRARATVAALLDQFPDIHRDQLQQRHPFRDDAIVQRWSAHLAAAGVP